MVGVYGCRYLQRQCGYSNARQSIDFIYNTQRCCTRTNDPRDLRSKRFRQSGTDKISTSYYHCSIISCMKKQIWLITLIFSPLWLLAQQRIVVDATGKGNYTTIQEAVNSLPD